MLEREIDVAFLQEIWENSDNENYQAEVEKMFEENNLFYKSATRSKAKNNVTYGGAALIVNTSKFTFIDPKVHVPSGLEVVWGLIKPKTHETKFKKIIICSFYSPPGKYRYTAMSDYICSTLHLLYTKHPESGIILGADKNSMNITPILNCGLKLRQIVDQITHGNKIIDVIITNLSSHYKSPLIAPPIESDDPSRGVASDHSVPVAIPHRDRWSRPKRSPRIITFRPLPETKVRDFGEWLVHEEWNSILSTMSSTEQAEMLDSVMQEKLNLYCPQQTMKLFNRDKPFITKELKHLDRKRNREYLKSGKSFKYYELKKKFDKLYKLEARKYIDKNIDTLGKSNPGKAFKTLKRLGSHSETNSHNDEIFVLPAHENLSASDCAESIAAHFSHISSSFPPLTIDSLPLRVKEKLRAPGCAPNISDYEVYRKIQQSKKPRSGTQYDLPKDILSEFGPEIATPLTKIVNKIFSTGEWPKHWKIEHVVPIPKVPSPETEDDLRPISLTPFFSKVTERFVVEWLLEIIGPKLDFRQYGGLKGNSITHYVIEFINFVLSSQDNNDQTAVLACFVDFQKAFMRQNHNTLIVKLSDLEVPGWLLNIIIGFLKERSMFVKYRGSQSSVKQLPGGGPQGTLLALLLFLVLVNDVGFEDQRNNAGEIATSKRNIKRANEIHMKFVDDLTMAEAVKLGNGQQYSLSDSKLFQQLKKTQLYSEQNDMKINFKKTKVMVFNPTTIKFSPTFELEGQDIEIISEIKLLGLHISNDMKWKKNTCSIIQRASKKLWILRRLKNLGARTTSLVEVYRMQIRCILEYGVPAWQGSLTLEDKKDIERVQKCALHIILGNKYSSYEDALECLNLENLELRRVRLCLNFALKAESHPKFSKWFIRRENLYNTRSKLKYKQVLANHARYSRSPLGYLTKLLNIHYNSQ